MKYFQQFIDYIKTNEVKVCLVRCDFNIPSDIIDLTRVYAIKQTIEDILKLGLKVVLITHYRRPKSDDILNPDFSLSSIVSYIAEALKKPIKLVKTSIYDLKKDSFTDDITLLENLRFYPEETKNDNNFAKALANLADVYINDAFSICHRAHSSVSAITKYIPSFAGYVIQKEVEMLSHVMKTIARPYTAIIGGSKVSTKIDVLKSLSQTADYLFIGGAMANTFLGAKGYNMQKSLIEPELFDLANSIIRNSRAKIILPTDFVISKNIKIDGIEATTIPEDYAVFDIGEKTLFSLINRVSQSHTVLWNGPLGAFEFCNFNRSSKSLAQAIADLTINNNLFSVIGGGETVAAVKPFDQNMSFVSTAGGAFLEFIAGHELPGLAALDYYK